MKKIKQVLMGALLLASVGFVGCKQEEEITEINYELVKFNIAAPEAVGESVFGANVIKFKPVQYAHGYDIYRKNVNGRFEHDTDFDDDDLIDGEFVYYDRAGVYLDLEEGKTYTYKIVPRRIESDRAATSVGVFSDTESIVFTPTIVEITVEEGNMPPKGKKLPAPKDIKFEIKDEHIYFNQDSNADGNVIKTVLVPKGNSHNNRAYDSNEYFAINEWGNETVYFYAKNTCNYDYYFSDEVFVGIYNPADNASEDLINNAWNCSTQYLKTIEDENSKVIGADFIVLADGKSIPHLSHTIVRETVKTKEGYKEKMNEYGDWVQYAVEEIIASIASETVDANIVESTIDKTKSEYIVSFTEKDLPKAPYGFKYMYYAIAKDASGKEYKHLLTTLADWVEEEKVVTVPVDIPEISFSVENIEKTSDGMKAKLSLAIQDEDTDVSYSDISVEYYVLKYGKADKPSYELVWVGQGKGDYDEKGNYQKVYIEYQRDNNGDIEKDEEGNPIINHIEHFGAYEKQEIFKTINTLACSGTVTGFEDGKTKDFELKELSNNASYHMYWKVIVNGVVSCVHEDSF